MQTIDNQLKTNNLSRFHLVYGEEKYMVTYYSRQIISKLSTEGDTVNTTFYEGETLNLEDFDSLGNTLPFFAENRLMVVKRSGLFGKSSEMTSILDSFPDSTYVLFVEDKIDGRNSLVKWMKKNGCVTECKQKNEHELAGWIAGYLKRYGKTIPRREISYLISKVGFSMNTLSTEMDKLIGYIGDANSVTTQDIDAICSGQVVDKVFDMIDAVMTGNSTLVYKLYRDLQELREPAPVLVRLFQRHINILIQVKELSRSKADKIIANELKIPTFAIGKYKQQANGFKRSELIHMLENITESEELFKTGQMKDELSVEMFFIRALTNC
ncbi:DNA polymerase III subunit delta [Eubacterium xylanophilum]|uniref:DNA polymerase III subunit delta n=1 Tax=Eubacterium xylanophilum TaxID=39497 RepID=UPI00047A9E93|nr:DNA polymerase III subunit delta [Eubacterium xylanophilum]